MSKKLQRVVYKRIFTREESRALCLFFTYDLVAIEMIDVIIEKLRDSLWNWDIMQFRGVEFRRRIWNFDVERYRCLAVVLNARQAISEFT